MMASSSSSFIDDCISIILPFLWCLSRLWPKFTMEYESFAIEAALTIALSCIDLSIVKKGIVSFSTSYLLCFCRLQLRVKTLVFINPWSYDSYLTVFMMLLMFGSIWTGSIMPLCIKLLATKKKMAIWSSLIFAFMGIVWVSLWCFSTCWLEYTISVIFLVSVTSKMKLILCVDHVFRGKKNRRVERETMRGRGLLSNRIDKDKLKPGDHIYSWRHGWIYAHHGVYGRDGKVIHLTRGGGQKFGTGIALDTSPSYSEDNPMNPCPTCGYQLNRGGARVISSCMECFLSGGNLYLFHYDVSIAFFLAKLRGGTCTLAPSDPPEMVLDRAESLLSKDHNTKIRNGFADYHIMNNNCEDFAMYCKTGLHVYFDFYPSRTYFKTVVPRTMYVRNSGQVVSLCATAIAVLFYLVFGFCGAILGFGYYFFDRLSSDVGRFLECENQVHKRFSPSVSEELEAMAEVANESKSLVALPDLEAGIF